MAANRQLLTLCLLFFLTGALFAQGQKKSFQFKDYSLEKALREVVEAHGYYLSFKAGIFDGAKSVSFSFSQLTLESSVEKLLSDDFQYEIIGKYVVITRRLAETKKVVQSSRPILYDTILVPKEVIVYDTQTVIQQQVRYDTVRVPMLSVVVDTVQVGIRMDSTTKSWSFGGFFGVLQRRRFNGLVDADYRGIELGASVQHQRGNYTFQVDLSYQYLIDQIANTSIEEVTETRIDTVSTFFIIRDGIRQPVYVTETSEVTSEVRTNIDRTNTLQVFGLSLTGGYQYPLGDVSIGARLGIRVDWMISRDEWLFLDNQRVDDQAIQYAAPATSLVAHFPVTFQRQDLMGAFSLTPFFQYGLNQDILTPDIGGNRAVLGMRIGILF